MIIRVRLIKPLKSKIVTYESELLKRTETSLLIHACWQQARLDLDYVVFEPGDNFFEYFYSDRWYNIYIIYSAKWQLKGWYCNITRPAIFTENRIESEDLELDLFVSADYQKIFVLDEDEFAARGLESSDPVAYRAALATLAELQERAMQGNLPTAEKWVGQLCKV